jgi:hypothetical protein
MATDFRARFSGGLPRAKRVESGAFPRRHTANTQPTTSKESPAMGSIKKKRRAKMSKHKHDKRIKLERHKTK